MAKDYTPPAPVKYLDNVTIVPRPAPADDPGETMETMDASDTTAADEITIAHTRTELIAQGREKFQSLTTTRYVPHKVKVADEHPATRAYHVPARPGYVIVGRECECKCGRRVPFDLLPLDAGRVLYAKLKEERL